MKQIQQHKQPCKYGATCKFLASNNCYYYHPVQEVADYDRRADYNNKSSHHQRRPEGKNTSRGENGNLYHQNKAQENYQQDYSMKTQHHHRGKDVQTNGKGFCKYFHYEAQCPYGEKCVKKHDFLFEKDRKLRRLMHRKDIPQSSVSRLAKINNFQKEILSLRMGNEMVLFEYQFENNEILGIGEPFAFPQIKTKYEYYDQKDHYIYYSASNQNQLIDIGFEDLMLQEKVWIKNSHTCKVTGIAHYDQNVFFSASIAGDIKMWVKTEEGYVVDKGRTEGLRNAYNPNNLPLQILFLNIEEVEGVKVLVAGTNDGRILTWSGSNLDLLQITLDQSRSKVFKVELLNQGSFIGAFVLAWDSKHHFSSVFLLNLQNGDHSPIFEVEAGEKADRNLNTFDIIGEFIFISSLNGQVSILDLSNNCKKIGAILHQQMVLDIICSAVQVKSTGVCLKLVYILEKKTEGKEGSFSVYLLQ